MVIEYLEKISQNIESERKIVKEKLDEINLVINENIKFIQYLESSMDSNGDVFSPLSVNPDKDERLIELQEEQRNLIETQNSLKVKYDSLTNDYDESISVLKVAYEIQTKSDKIADDSLSVNELLKLKLLETQEAERQRIARELHDSSVQTVTSLVHKTELCSKLIELDPIRCKLELMVMSKSLKEVIQEMRNMIYNLRPMSFDDIGFDVTIEREMSKIESQGIIHTNLIIEGNPYKLKQVIALTLLRIIQEACSNTVKHAKASNIEVKIIYSSNMVETFITDDGEGFDASNYSSEIREDNSGFGMNTMKERVYLLSGNIDIDSKPGKGTKIHIQIPIKEDTKND